MKTFIIAAIIVVICFIALRSCFRMFSGKGCDCCGHTCGSCSSEIKKEDKKD